MKITKIKLKNIGPYRGDNNIFNFDVKKDQNIILIGGKNGSGKTTLLNSIKIGLFGTYSYGFKTNGNLYYDELKQIFNYIEIKKENANFEIEIEFELIENYIINNYNFIRKWSKENQKINESFSVMKNNDPLPNEQIEEIQDKLREMIPPTVIDTMLFDGEKIAQIIDHNKISEYLKEMVYVNFNINIFEKMDDDIKYYIEKEKNRNAFSTDEINILECKNKYSESLKEVKNAKNILQEYKKTYESKKFRLKNLNKKFENYGGLTEEAKEHMKSSLQELENNRKQNSAIIKEFLEDDIVFYMNRDRITKIKENIQAEKPKLLLKYINEIEEFLQNDSTKNIKNQLEKMIKNDKTEIKYEATQKLDSLLDKIIEKINNRPSEKMKSILKNSRTGLNSSKTYRKLITNNENANSKDLKTLLEEIKKLEVEIDELNEKIKETGKNIKAREIQTNSYQIELEKMDKRINSDHKEENSFNIARKILQVSEFYKKIQIRNYLDKIEELSVKKFEEVHQKENYISKIKIDRETYAITLYDSTNIEKEITLLSAGEKQLLISAIVWSIFKISDRNNIFTFDTPLARLDKDNRELFVKNILCTISDQVLILSTDQEIIGELYKSIKNNISKQYILNNDNQLGKTEIKEGYFKS